MAERSVPELPPDLARYFSPDDYICVVDPTGVAPTVFRFGVPARSPEVRREETIPVPGEG